MAGNASAASLFATSTAPCLPRVRSAPAAYRASVRSRGADAAATNPNDRGLILGNVLASRLPAPRQLLLGKYDVVASFRTIGSAADPYRLQSDHPGKLCQARGWHVTPAGRGAPRQAGRMRRGAGHVQLYLGLQASLYQHPVRRRQGTDVLRPGPEIARTFSMRKETCVSPVFF